MTVPLSEGDRSTPIKRAADLYRIMQAVLLRENEFHRRREYFWIVGLKVDHTMDFVELAAIGQDNRVACEPVDVLATAVSRKIKRIILIHNQTSKKLMPSVQDVMYIRSMVKAADLMKIKIVDALPINETDYYPFIDMTDPLNKDKKGFE